MAGARMLSGVLCSRLPASSQSVLVAVFRSPDCCGVDRSYSYCDPTFENAKGVAVGCSCLDCLFEAVTDGCAPQLNPCEKVSWAGDGTCDDGNNIAGCDWDGGDCRGSENRCVTAAAQTTTTTTT